MQHQGRSQADVAAELTILQCAQHDNDKKSIKNLFDGILGMKITQGEASTLETQVKHPNRNSTGRILDQCVLIEGNPAAKCDKLGNGLTEVFVTGWLNRKPAAFAPEAQMEVGLAPYQLWEG